MRDRFSIFLVVFILVLGGGCKNNALPPDNFTSVPIIPYQEVGPVKDASFAGIRRVSTRITLERNHAQAEIEATLKQAVENLAHRENASAAIVYAYYPGDDTSSVYTVAMATYAPNGRWGDVGQPGAMQSVVEINPDTTSEGRRSEAQTATSVMSQKKIVCNKFRIITREEGGQLLVSLDTDLPDTTQVMVTVGRDYKATLDGKSDTYAEAYLEASSTVGEWRTVHRVDIQDSIFRQALAATRERAKAQQTSMTVGKISSNIDAQFIVPINQVDAIFAKGNANLGGSAVLHKDSWNIIEREQHVPHPLGG